MEVKIQQWGNSAAIRMPARWQGRCSKTLCLIGHNGVCLRPGFARAVAARIWSSTTSRRAHVCLRAWLAQPRLTRQRCAQRRW